MLYEYHSKLMSKIYCDISDKFKSFAIKFTYNMKITVLFITLIVLLSNCNLFSDRKDNMSESKVGTTTITDKMNFEYFMNLFDYLDLPFFVDTINLRRWNDYNKEQSFAQSELQHIKLEEVFEKCGDPPFPLYDVFPVGKLEINNTVKCVVIFLRMVDECPNEAAYQRVFLLSYNTEGQQISYLEFAYGLHLGVKSEWMFGEIDTNFSINQVKYDIYWVTDTPKAEKKELIKYIIKPNGIIRKIEP